MANKNIKINLDYSSFVGGVKECQSKIQILNNEFKLQSARMGETASETDKLSLKSQTLTQQIGLQEQVVAQAMARWDAMANSENSTIQQTEAAHKAYQKQATVLANMRNELDSTNQALEETAKAEEGASEAANSGNQSFGEYASSISSAISVATSLVSALQQLGSEIVSVATKTTEWADELNTMSAKTSLSTKTLQELGYASSFVDVSLDTTAGALTKLTRNMGEVASGSDSAKQKFSQLGVEVMAGNGQLKTSEQVFYEVIDALRGIDNEAERDAAAMGIFGKSATELNPLIEQGSAALQAYGEEAEKLGLIMDGDAIDSLNSMQDNFDKLSSVIDAAQNRIGAALAPAISSIAEVLANANPAVVEMIAGLGLAVSTVSKLAPLIQGVAMVTTMSTTAKIANTVATNAEAAAETELAASAAVADAALLPQIAAAALLMAALAALILIIKELVDMFKDEASAADKAAASTKNFTQAASGKGSANNSNSVAQTSEHHAMGGWTRSNKVWVGEQGAELVDLPVGSYVHNSTDSRNMSSTSNVFNVTIDAKNVDDFNKVVNVFNGLSQSMNRGSRVNG